LSETIRVRSIVDRFLEHSRIYVFGVDDEAKVFISSADWMPRNFFRRVELMVPIQSPDLVARVLREIIPVYLADNTRARVMDSEGKFHLQYPGPGEAPLRAQVYFLAERVATPKPEAGDGIGEGGGDSRILNGLPD
jgi:polyphosphate kinase